MATETEIEAMARALSHQAQEEPNVMWRNWTNQAAVAANALDRVRADDARDGYREALLRQALEQIVGVARTLVHAQAIAVDALREAEDGD